LGVAYCVHGADQPPNVTPTSSIGPAPTKKKMKGKRTEGVPVAQRTDVIGVNVGVPVGWPGLKARVYQQEQLKRGAMGGEI
jgi:hypothetical protein